MAGFGDRIRGHRQLLNLNQQELADRIGVKDGDTIGDWERLSEPGPRFPYQHLKALADALGVPIDQLTEGPDEYAASLRRELREELAAALARIEERLRRAGI